MSTLEFFILPKADILLDICELLDIPIDWLVKGYDYKKDLKNDDI